MKRTPESFTEDVQHAVGDEYTFIDTYVNEKTKLTVRHNKCGRVYSVAPMYFLTRGTRCMPCARIAQGKRQRMTPSTFFMRCEEVNSNKFEILSEFTKTRDKLSIKCKTCGSISDVRADCLLKPINCKECLKTSFSKMYVKTTKTYADEVAKVSYGEYTLVSEYTRVSNPIKIRHNVCNSVYNTTPHQFNRGRRCPNCNLSKGEQLVRNYLKKHRIKYISQKKFKGLGNLSYDFFIPSEDILIEYQGIQHYRPVDLFGGEPAFEIQQRNDEQKRIYAECNNYTLIAIAYTVTSEEQLKEVLPLSILASA